MTNELVIDLVKRITSIVQENRALCRQLAELRQALEGVAGTLEGIAGTMDSQPRHIVKAAVLEQAKQARAD